MTDPDILDRIDDTLDDYDQWDGHSPDAARWAGGPEDSEWGEPRSISFSGERRLWLVEPSDGDAPTLTELGSVTEFTPILAGELQPFQAAVAAFAELTGLAMTEWQRRLLELSVAFGDIKRQTEASTGKSWAYLAQRAQRPHSAAERTRSPRWRAGTRRAKRQARRRHG